MRYARVVPVIVGVVCAAPACAHRVQNAVAPACAPVSEALPAGAPLNPMAGRFVITMVASSGRASGQTAAGYLTLRQAPADLPPPGAGARTVFVGVTEVGLEVVGAMRLGDTGSENPRAPGVAVYEQRPAAGAATVSARIGSAITGPAAPGMMPIEGAYTALFVKRIGAQGFAGDWTSGDGVGGEARGHFCAVRVT